MAIRPFAYDITHSVVFRDNTIRITIRSRRGVIEFLDNVMLLKAQFAACYTTRINIIEMPSFKCTLPMDVIEYIHLNILNPIPYAKY